jgi:hypothetical protein
MQSKISFAGHIDETMRVSFIKFQHDPMNRFKVNVRRTRSVQLRQLMSSPDAIDLRTFLYEVWNIESKTYLRSRNLELRIFAKPSATVFSLDRLLGQSLIPEDTVTLSELENALASGDLELHGNYIWGQATRAYDIRFSKSDEQKVEQISKAVLILNDHTLTPLDKARQIDAIPGFGGNNATGLVMVFHPDEFALVNGISGGMLKKLGVNLTASTSLEVIQSELRSLKEELGASDFLELDWFLYLCNQGEYSPGGIEASTGGENTATWFQVIKQILEDAGEPLAVPEITTRALTSGIQTKGKTPDRTVSNVLTTNPHVFERVSEGVYQLKSQTEPLPEPSTLPLSSGYREPTFGKIAEFIHTQGLRMDEQILRRYHLALKTRGFVILSGISGIGKTWLAEVYAGAVGANYCLVPVAPNWTTNEDLLGYVDPLNELLFHHTIFSYFLEAAAQEYEQAREEGRTAKPYHLVLDEMNLARMEYYFAKFLSAMEIRARSGAAPIELGAQKIINIYPNLFFVGTINVDETTHGFADKIYDRAQLIELTVSRETLRAHIGDELYDDVLMAVWDAIHDVAPFAFRVLDEIKKYHDTAVDMPTGYATSERRGGESPEKLAKTTEMCLPERKRVRKGGEEDDRSCRPHPGGPDRLAEHAVLVWGSGCGGACAPAIRGPQSHPGARALCARSDGQV